MRCLASIAGLEGVRSAGGPKRQVRVCVRRKVSHNETKACAAVIEKRGTVNDISYMRGNVVYQEVVRSTSVAGSAVLYCVCECEHLKCK
jgi:hypothetical protein